MLVIDRIELGLFDQVADIGKFHHHLSVVAQERPHPGDQVILVLHMGDDVVGDDHAGLAALCG